MFQKLVTDDGLLEVIDVSEKQESKGRPSGLNTVNLLKVSRIMNCFCQSILKTCILMLNTTI